MMKKINSKILFFSTLVGLMLFTNACVKDLLNQTPSDLAAGAFWKTEADATIAIMGTYNQARLVFDRDYYLDGHGEYHRTRGMSWVSGSAQYIVSGTAAYARSGFGSSFDNYFKALYGLINRANYVIDNVQKSLPTASATSVVGLERVVGEARMLRALAYFRLISFWGDVPYIGKVVTTNEEVSTLSRLPIGQVKDSILSDLTYAFAKLPIKSTEVGRASKPAALALRGKVQLYWASWKNFGWPELKGFTTDATEATAAYTAAADDFNAVIKNYSLSLFRNGAPGSWGTMGDNSVLPNYFYLFMPTANSDGELILAFTHGTTGTLQGEELMRDFGNRSTEGSQLWVMPEARLIDRYQSTITGDFVTPIVRMNPNVPSTNNVARTTVNSAVNPATYANRDFRMKATVLWDYEKMVKLTTLKDEGSLPLIYGRASNATELNPDGCVTGIIYRKFIRNYGGAGRSDGDYSFPLIRLADVYLMYAEATNFASGPQADAIALVNQIRGRGNLPALAAAKTATKDEFFKAIEQERIVELIGEGHRGFDIRRWRKIESIWGAPNGAGLKNLDTWGTLNGEDYKQVDARGYARNYIFKIPQSERDRNPNLTQNECWL